MVFNEVFVTNNIQNERHSPLVFCEQERDVKSLTTTGSLPGCHEERLEKYAADDGLTSV